MELKILSMYSIRFLVILHIFKTEKPRHPKTRSEIELHLTLS